LGYLWQYIYSKILEISSVSNFDYINIVGHYNKLTLAKQVDPRLLARGYTEEQLKVLHSKMNVTASEFISLNLHFKGDADKWDYPYFNYIITLCDAYELNGVMPFEGAHVDQPAKIIEIFQILSQLKIERQNKINEEQNRQNQKESRKPKRK
jgi:hypothetical protein